MSCDVGEARERLENDEKFCSKALISAWGSFTCRKSMTRDPRLYFPSEGRNTRDFYALKYPSTPAGFEPAILASSGEYDNHGTTGVDSTDLHNRVQIAPYIRNYQHQDYQSPHLFIRWMISVLPLFSIQLSYMSNNIFNFRTLITIKIKIKSWQYISEELK